MSDHKSDINDYDIAANVEDTEVDQIIKVSPWSKIYGYAQYAK